MSGAATLLAAVVVHDDAWSTDAQLLARRAIGDTLAVGIAGLHEEQVELARRAVDGGSPAGLAFLGGVACHALDWVDYFHPLHGHASAVLLPAAWAVLAGSGSGADLLDAYLAGYQAEYLLGLLTSHRHYLSGWHATSTVGAVGAAAAAARALRLDEAGAAHALGIAASSAAGLRANFGTTTKALHAGHAARAGVEAALMAQGGARSSADWLTGTFGLLALMSAEVAPEAAPRTIEAFLATGRHGITQPYGLAQKPYSCCGSCHAGVDAVLALVVDHDLAPEDMAAIELHVDASVPRVMPQPLPTDPHAARYCLPWVVAAAAHDRALGPAQFTPDALASPDRVALMERVRVVPDLLTTADDRYAGRAVVVTTDGRRLEHDVRHAHGHPARPMTDDQLRAKQALALLHAGHAASLEELLAFVDGVTRTAVLPHHWTR